MESRTHWLAKALNLAVFLVLGAAPVFAQQNDFAKQFWNKVAAKQKARALEGLKDCGLVVEDLSEDATRGGLNERNLQREVATRLSAIGIKTGNAPSLSSPFMYVSVLVTRLSNGGYVFAVTLELREMVVPEREKDKEANLFLATTWSQFSGGTANRNGSRRRLRTGSPRCLTISEKIIRWRTRSKTAAIYSNVRPLLTLTRETCQTRNWPGSLHGFRA
jgi:hypothetical protein